MEYPIIEKPMPEEMVRLPNLLDLESTRSGFSWHEIYNELDWLPGGYLNKAHECIDRHCDGNGGNKLALIWVSKTGTEEKYTFSQLRDQTNKFANVLQGLGVQKGDRVFLFLDLSLIHI